MAKTMVVFRVYPDGEAIALFPCEYPHPYTVYCRRYTSRNQKGFDKVFYQEEMEHTRPATPEEAMPLADELKGLGYSLAVRQRAPSAKYRAMWLAMGND